MLAAYEIKSKVRNVRWLLGLLWAVIFSSLTACETLNTYLSSDDRSAALLIPNLVDEECRIEKVTEEPVIAAHSIDSQYQIYCGRWENASGSIFKVSATDNQDLAQWLSTGPWSDWLNKKAFCDKNSEQTVLGNYPALVLNCRLRNGGWPYLAMIIDVDNTIYLTDGIPAVEPVLEDGVGILSGVKPYVPVSSTGGGEKPKRTAKFFREKDLYGANDIHSYYRLMQAGQFYNGIKDFKTAAERYRQALALQERIVTEEATRIDPMMHLALEISNQGRFEEAELLFDRVETLLKNVSDENQEARYLSYKALHAANKRDFNQALEFAHRANQMRRDLVKQARERQLQIAGVSVAKSSETTPTSILGKSEEPNPFDMVQSLYIEGAMLEKLGRVDEAEEHLREAKALWQRAYEIPPTWEPELVGLTARIAKAKGAHEEQSQLLTKAVSLWENVAPGERPSVINYLKLGDAYRQQGQLEQALSAFRNAIELAKQRNGSLSFDQLAPFFKTALQTADALPDRKTQIYAEMFEAGQLIRSERTTETIAKAVARFSTAEGSAGEVMRDYQEAQDQRHFLYQDYEIALAKPETPEQVGKIAALKDKLAVNKRRLNELGIQVQAAMPR
ncbi:MAG: tetratricopeptide repeat protein, partial [Gammaproteobacteria bacterium]